MHAEEKCSTKERGLSNVKWCHLQQGLSLLYKSGTIKNIILLYADQVISLLCFFNDKVEYPILLQAGATLPKIGARYMTRAADVFCSKPYGWPSQPMHQLPSLPFHLSFYTVISLFRLNHQLGPCPWRPIQLEGFAALGRQPWPSGPTTSSDPV